MSAVDRLLEQLQQVDRRSAGGREARDLAYRLADALGRERDDATARIAAAEQQRDEALQQQGIDAAKHVTDLQTQQRETARLVKEAHEQYALVHHDRGIDQTVESRVVKGDRYGRDEVQPFVVEELEEALFRFRVAGASSRTPVAISEGSYRGPHSISCKVHLPMPLTREQELAEQRERRSVRRRTRAVVAGACVVVPPVVLAVAALLVNVYQMVWGWLV